MRRTTCVFHCAGCGAHFASLVSFDLHRRGTPNERHCVAPDDVEGRSPSTTLVVKTEHGYCDLKWGEPSDNATIYQTAEAAQSSWNEVEGPQALTTDVQTGASSELPLAA